MKYLEVTFSIQPFSEDKSDVLAAMAGEIGFESFSEYEEGLKAYIQENLLDRDILESLLVDFPFPDTKISYVISSAAYQNWNGGRNLSFSKPRVCPRIRIRSVCRTQAIRGTGGAGCPGQTGNFEKKSRVRRGAREEST